MSDIYFEDQADECLRQLLEAWADKSPSEIKHLIYIKLKEVARDQRYACILNIQKIADKTDINSIFGAIQNANIVKEV